MESATKGQLTDPTGTNYYFDFNYGDWGKLILKIEHFRLLLVNS